MITQQQKIHRIAQMLLSAVFLAMILFGVSLLNTMHDRSEVSRAALTNSIRPAMFTQKIIGPVRPSSNIFGSGVPVLMYHYIGDLPANSGALRRDLTVSVSDFTAQMDYLKAQGYSTVTSSELYQATQKRFKLPAKPVVVTLDDGYQNAFQNAVPILARDGFRGVFAVITAYPDHYSGYADWQTIAAAQSQGMEIIPHTQHHIDLTNKKYTLAEVTGELQGSIADLKQHLGDGSAPAAFVYPYGDYNQTDVGILSGAGIKTAFTTKFGMFRPDRQMLMAEPRVRVHGGESLDKFIATLANTKARPVPVKFAPTDSKPVQRQ